MKTEIDKPKLLNQCYPHSLEWEDAKYEERKGVNLEWREIVPKKKKQKRWLSATVSTAGYSRYDSGGAADSVAQSWRESEKETEKKVLLAKKISWVVQRIIVI